MARKKVEGKTSPASKRRGRSAPAKDEPKKTAAKKALAEDEPKDDMVPNEEPKTQAGPTLEDLKAAVDDLNDVLKPKPPIAGKDKAVLTKALLVAAEQLVPKDDKEYEPDAVLPTTAVTLKALGYEGTLAEREAPVVVEKPEKAPKEKKAKAPKEKKAAEGPVDAFGFREGSISAMFIKAIQEAPMTMSEIKKASWNKNGATFYNVWKKIVAEGKGGKDEQGRMALL